VEIFRGLEAQAKTKQQTKTARSAFFILMPSFESADLPIAPG
jgi:hypothetical protein